MKDTLDLGSIDLASEVAPTIMKFVYGGGIGATLFVLMVFMAAMTTGGNCVAGAQALLSVDVYKGIVNKDATERQQLRFGKFAAAFCGIAVAVIATFLENVSLLSLDIFSGILFAAPVSAFVAGLFWNKPNTKIALTSIIIGWSGAMIAWFTASTAHDSMFYGNMCSLLLPAFIIIVGGLFTRGKYNFDSMQYGNS